MNIIPLGLYSPFNAVEADVTCPFLDDPMDGTVLFPVDRRPTDRATYRCNDGFVRVGDLIRECQENGMWTGEAPICRRM